MKTDRQIYFWAHMLDECFNKDQFICEDKEGKTLEEVKVMKNYPFGIEDKSIIQCKK